MRFFSLRRLQVALRYPRQPADGPSRFDVRFTAQLSRRPVPGATNFVLAVFSPCVHRSWHAPRPRLPRERAFVAGGFITHFRFTPGSTGSFAAVSLRAAFRYPLVKPPHDRAESFIFRFRQRSWDLSALRSFPCSRVPAFSAVHPHMPLSKSFRPADFYGYRSQIENSFQATRGSDQAAE